MLNSALTDEGLLAMLGGPHGGAALAALMRRHEAGMMAALRRLLRGAAHEDREEVLNTTFLRAAHAHHHYDPRRGAARSWLYTILHRCALDRLRALRRRGRERAMSQHAEPLLAERVPAATAAPEAACATAEQRGLIRDWAAGLPDKQRAMLLGMHPELAGGGPAATFEQLGAALGVSTSCAFHHYRAGVRQLRRRARQGELAVSA